MILDQEGDYYFEIISNRWFFNLDNSFTTFVVGEVIETIDLNKKFYFSTIKIEEEENQNPSIYKVKNLKESKYVFFYSQKIENGYDLNEEKLNPFIVCNDNTQECKQNIILYYFEKENEYTIYINFIKYESDFDIYYYYPFLFFPIIKTTIENRSKGMIITSVPKIYNINLDSKATLNLNVLHSDKFFITEADSPITENNINDIQNLYFRESTSDEPFELNNKYKYTILIVMPSIDKYLNKDVRVLIADYSINNVTTKELIIPAKKNCIIFSPNCLYEDKNPLRFYNILAIFSSSSNNMRYSFSTNPENNHNYLFHNFYAIPMYIDEAEKEQKINIKSYYPRYAFFGVVNSEIFNLLHEYLYLYIKNYNGISVDLKDALPLNIRVNSDLSPLYEFFNFYFHEFEDNLNLYIKKIYGGTELFECNDKLDINDLSILQTPINNCKDKKSIFNRPFTFKGTKELTGYLSPNSFFDVYIEFNDASKKITISSLLKGTVNHASKYIKKDEEYTVDFAVDHMVKIEIVDNIKVIISNGINTTELNSENPASKIEGNNYKVISNRDTMIYFYGKLTKYFKQVLIDPNQKGKFLTIKSNWGILFAIDSGFEGYNPINIEFTTYSNYDDNPSIVYVENIYQKMKLVKDEYIYVYYIKTDYSDDEEEDYDYNNVELIYNDGLNNPNNEYTFNVIPSNSETKSFIIYNKFKEGFIPQVIFCSAPHEVIMKLENSYGDTIEKTFNETNIIMDLELAEYGTKINFKSKEEFLFSYSFHDYVDDQFLSNTDFVNERKVLTNLEITNVRDKSNKNNIILVTFRRNYINSSTRYIIVIASLNDDNAEDNFSNPCYVAKLLTEKQSGIKTENYFDPGLNELITAEVNIDDILNENNNYTAVVISQELRFEKKLNFYPPLQFIHKKRQTNGNGGNNTKTLVIVFAIVGGVLALIIIIFLIRFLRKRNNKEIETSIMSDNNSLSLTGE